MDCFRNGKSNRDFKIESIAMFTPSLVTYTFYKDPETHERRKSALIDRAALIGVGSSQVLNFARGVGAFSLIFGGDSVAVPLCQDTHFSGAKFLRSEKVIDAFRAGRQSDRGKRERYYEGNMLAVGVALAESTGIKLDPNELSDVLANICDESKQIRDISGFEGSLRKTISASCRDQGINYKFLQKF